MNKFILPFLFILTITSCVSIQSQQNSENNSQPTLAINYVNNEGKEIGYPRFTTSDKQYLGCWRSVEADEVIKYELKFFRLTEKTIQTSKMMKSVSFTEKDSNIYKDYFVLHIEENKDIQPYLSINMVSDNEMTIQEFATENIADEEGINYWVLKREDCNQVVKKLKNK